MNYLLVAMLLFCSSCVNDNSIVPVIKTPEQIEKETESKIAQTEADRKIAKIENKQIVDKAYTYFWIGAMICCFTLFLLAGAGAIATIALTIGGTKLCAIGSTVGLVLGSTSYVLGEYPLICLMLGIIALLLLVGVGIWLAIQVKHEVDDKKASMSYGQVMGEIAGVSTDTKIKIAEMTQSKASRDRIDKIKADNPNIRLNAKSIASALKVKI